MKTYFFGTFDPVHSGHIKIVQTFGAIFVPTPAPPHKPTDASFFDRVQMLKLVSDNVCEIESEINPPNYTHKTIERLGKCNFILGYDQFLKIESWVKPEYLKEMLHFIVIPRVGAKAADFAHLKEKGYNFEIADFELMNISSSEIRRRVKNGENIDDLTDKKVKNYIYEKRLYSQMAK